MAISFKNRKTALAAIGVVMFLYAFFNSAYVQLTTPLLSTIIREQGYTDPTLANMIVTMGNLAQIPANILGGILGSRMDKKRMSYVSAALVIGGSLAVIPLAGNIFAVLACRAVVGFGSGMLILISTAILPDFYEGKQLSTMIGLVLAGSGFWGFISSNVAGFVNQAAGWQTAYLLYLYGVVPMALFALVVPRSPFVTKAARMDKDPKAAADAKSHAPIAPMVYVYALVGAASFMLVQLVWSNSSLWVEGTIGGTAAQAGMASSVLSLFSCLARLGFGALYGKLGRWTVHLNIAMLIAGLAVASFAGSFPMALVALAFVGAAMGLVAPTCLNRCIEVAPHCQERAQAITSVGFALGNFGSTYWLLFVNGLGDGSLTGAFSVNTVFATGFLMLAVLVSLAMIRKEQAQSVAE